MAGSSQDADNRNKIAIVFLRGTSHSIPDELYLKHVSAVKNLSASPSPDKYTAEAVSVALINMFSSTRSYSNYTEIF